MGTTPQSKLVCCALAAFTVLAAPTLMRAQVITTVAGTNTNSYSGDGGPATSASLSTPLGIATDFTGNLFIADSGNFRLREVTTAGIINTVAGNGMVGFGLGGGNIGDGGPATSAELGPASVPFMAGVAVDLGGNVYITDVGNYRVRKVDPSGTITTVAGSGSPIPGGDGGPATSAGFMEPTGVAVDLFRNIYIADAVNFRVRVVNAAGTIKTYAGNGTVGYSGDGGPATSAQLSVPVGLALDLQGNLYIAEAGNVVYGSRIRKVDTSGIITTVAGTGTIGYSGDGGPAINAQLGGNLQGVAVDHAGNIYIADYDNYRVRKVDKSGIITTVAGTGSIGGNHGSNVDGGLPTIAFVQPSGLALDPAGNLYISDATSSAIRKVTFGATPPGLSVSAASLYFAGSTLHNTGAPSQILSVSTAGPPLSFTITPSTTSGGPWLGTSTITGTTPSGMTVSVDIYAGTTTALPPGTYKGAFTITPTTPGYTTSVTVPVTLVLSATVPANPPAISTTNGILNAASNQPGTGIVPNSYVTIKGTNLASTTDTWNSSIVGGQLPTSLDGVTVTFEGRPGYISYISPTQINVLVPQIDLGSASVSVSNNGALGQSSSQTVGVNQYSPAFFLFSGSTQAIATRQDYSYAAKAGTIAGLTTTPAKPGDVLILWGTGFGATTPATLPGYVTPSDRAYSTTPVTVTINNVPATVYGAALAPGFAGLYQVAIQVPASLANGDWPIVATAGSATLDNLTSSPSGVILSVHN
ncbi:MAG TPA: IPT/TIG domain-containing protein [Bryobacteraceae bacterium]|nr:IPT/TIG domain-containing protein [Bryobacteraceae bacterium]